LRHVITKRKIYYN